jgi:hypothetical protein
VGLLHRGKRGRVGRSAMLLSIGLHHRRVCGRLSNGLQHRRVSGRLPNGLVNMRVECTLRTNTSKPNMGNTIEHAGAFACRVCFDLTSEECGNLRVEEKKSKSGGKFRKLVPDIEQRRRQGV